MIEPKSAQDLLAESGQPNMLEGRPFSLRLPRSKVYQILKDRSDEIQTVNEEDRERTLSLNGKFTKGISKESTMSHLFWTTETKPLKCGEV